MKDARANLSGQVLLNKPPVAKPVASNMTLSFNDVELSIPRGTRVDYLAELIGVLSPCWLNEANDKVKGKWHFLYWAINKQVETQNFYSFP